MNKRDYIGLFILFVTLTIVPLIINNDYYTGILVFAAINCMACIGLCLLMGYAGQISLGHAAFIGIGAYVSGYFTVRLGWNPWLAMGMGVLGSVITALFIGVPSLKLKGHYLAMATLGFGSILHIISVAAVDITGGPEGLNDIPYLNLFGLILDSDTKFFYFSWSGVIIGLYMALNLIHSRTGRGLRSIHGSEDAAESLGVDTSTYKIKIFILSAIYSSISGSLYAHYVNYIDPGPFDIEHSVLLVTMVAVGGMHSIWGAVTGSILLTLLPEFLSSWTSLFQKFGVEYKPDYDTIIYGSILLVIMLFLPEGLFGGMKESVKFVKKKIVGGNK